jgi:MFS family permease
LRTHWRSLAAASIGLSAGYSLVNYITNVFTPHLITAFGWSRSDLALIGVTAFLAIVTLPIAGRLADAFGTRRIALIGVIVAPIIFVSFSAMAGSLLVYFLLTLVQVVVVGGTTVPTTYSRLIARQFDKARGFALAIAACTPAIVGGAAAALLSSLIEARGWRAGYVAVAIGVGLGGLTALVLIPAAADFRIGVRAVVSASWGVYAQVARDRAFLLIVAAMFLCNLAFTLQTTQLKVMLLDQSVDPSIATLAVSLFALSVVVGRFVCGVALDRFPTYAVAAVAMGLPGIGLTTLATGTHEPVFVIGAVLLLGLALGGEGDLISYLVMRFFRMEVFSTVLGMVLAAVAMAVAGGSLLLSFMLKWTGDYAAFLYLTGTLALVGGSIFLLLKRVPAVS